MIFSKARVTVSGTDTEIVAYTNAGSFNSNPIPIHGVYGISIQVSNPSTGTPAGTWKLQTSDDYENNSTMAPDANIVTWNDVPSATVTISSAGSGTMELFSASRWVRLVYTQSSGSITATVRVHMKSMQ